MGLGVLEPKGHEQVPGTTRYYDDPDRPRMAGEHDAHLKTNDSGLILTPQPSDDPNDPLNWPILKRDCVTFLLCWAGVLATSLGPILAANTVTLIGNIALTITDAVVLTGYLLAGAGGAVIFFVPSARVYGKRHLFLLGLVIVIATSAWAGAVPLSADTPEDARRHFRSMAAARAIQGVGIAPFESLLNAAIGDMYFVHQRGIRMAFANLAVFGSAFFTPIVVGKITATIGLGWTFYFVAIFTGATLPAIVLFCPETAFRREARFNTDIYTEEDMLQPRSSGSSETNEKEHHSGFRALPTNRLQPCGDASAPRKTFVESMSLFDGRKTDDPYLTLLLRPFPLLMNPAFIWACLIQGTMIAWTIFMGALVASIFIGPPLFWGTAKSGYGYTGAFVGALIGFAICGLVADVSVRLMTAANKGVYEPEFRILLIIPMLIASAIGLFGFAITVEDVASQNRPVIIPLVFFGFEVAGMVIGAVASSLYIVDAYRDLAIEGFTLTILFKNFFSFVVTYYALDWLIAGGIRRVLVIISILQVVICLTSIPMYVYGKRGRAFFHRHDPIAMCRLKEFDAFLRRLFRKSPSAPTQQVS
ncbi:MFS transporter [Cordyceps fumosorosea ARSEF 2679]|uniref:MFS transporter n=1 Tax=Cordyceps fumosorosea (strain ARSEF 2679) TaxID=1081104 RepID=A0A167ZIE2_CORFA|nr:MFS transporter [Cordyceps fumosorosea ARSEF 2679]OAA67556.1 MFS transporter [Cordyceps fumosorosea ARSEF 2679]